MLPAKLLQNLQGQLRTTEDWETRADGTRQLSRCITTGSLQQVLDAALDIAITDGPAALAEEQLELYRVMLQHSEHAFQQARIVELASSVSRAEPSAKTVLLTVRLLASIARITLHVPRVLLHYLLANSAHLRLLAT